MRIYAALGPLITSSTLGLSFHRARYVAQKVLFSFAYREWSEAYDRYLLSHHGGGPNHHILLDSGAFSVMTQGITIDPLEYSEWVKFQMTKFGSRVGSMNCFNLDVIGNQKDSWKNQSIIEVSGIVPIPIVTHGASDADLLRAREYDVMALGGLVPLARARVSLRGWLDHAFSVLLKDRKEGDAFPKVHLLGITSTWALRRYPIFSADSSTWAFVSRYGMSRALEANGIPRIPVVGETYQTVLVNSLAIRAELLRMLQQEAELEALWKRRGVRFKGEA